MRFSPKERELRKKIRDCLQCPFLYDIINNGKKELMWGTGKDVLFIGQSPAISNLHKTRDSNFDKFFRQILAKTDISWNDIRFTNLCKTSIPVNGLITDKDETHLLQHLLEEIIFVKPKLVITLGAMAKKPFGLEFGESSEIEFVLTDKQGNKKEAYKVPVVACNHPAAIRYGKSEQEIIDQLNKAYGFRKGNTSKVDR